MTAVTIDLHDRDVIVVGRAAPARRAVARYREAGARVQRMLDADAVRYLAGQTGSETAEYLAWVEGEPDACATLREIARRRRIGFLCDEPVAPTPHGLVTLVGGGPGDAGLITLAGMRALAEADVVVHDRLGPRHVIAKYAPGAEIVDVGKRPGHHAVPQREIERLIVDRAGEGLRVVRLKGGDPFVFGRGGEEVDACRKAGVPVVVVPGVTSAIAVPAAVGIPVTHRELSRAFTVVSGHAPFSEEELGHLVGLGGTLVVLMGVGTLPHLVTGLRRHGMPREIPLAILENGFSIAHRSLITTVGDVIERLGDVKPVSPAVIVIGDVVAMAGPVGWALHETACEDTRTASAQHRVALTTA